MSSRAVLNLTDPAERAAGASSPAAPAPEACAPVTVRGLKKCFGSRHILCGVDLTVCSGEAVALIGSNGAGKSTLLRCCLRLVEPDAGDVDILGERVSGAGDTVLRSIRSRVGFVFQRHNLVPRLSVLTNVIHGAQARRHDPAVWFHWLAPKRAREEAMHCLDRVGLADLALNRCDTLSGGQSQRVAIARALMQRPSVMFADEPVASLDPQAGEEVMELFLDLIRREGLTLFYTSHHLGQALVYSDRVVGLRQGTLELDAPASTLDAESLRGIYE